MSFVDLATLAMHRRHELDERIKVFVEKCDLSIHGINELKKQAKGFIEHLNCEPADLKEKFLNCMKQLDEYNYLITDFNLAIGKIDATCNADSTPVQDVSIFPIIPESMAFNLLDALSEPTPSTSKACPNLCPAEKSKKIKTPKEDQLLITFSSNSCSSESVPVVKSEKEVQCKIVEKVKKISLDDSNTLAECNLPAQAMLQVDNIYPAVIVHVNGVSFWVITDNLPKVCDLMTDMTTYYKANMIQLNIDQLMTLTYCAYFDAEDNECFYRGLFIKLSEDDMSMAEVFLVDTGETRCVSTSHLQPLVPRFATSPPFARCCHLAGAVTDMLVNNEELMEAHLKEYVGKSCKIKVDDNTSESLGVYVIVRSETSKKAILNDIILKKGLALLEDKKYEEEGAVGGEGLHDMDEDNFNITDCQEYEDPVEAVTGYHNRDEMDICKHYDGGPDKTCFKGSRCTKKHVVKHPDGWTLDQIPVVSRCKMLPLPPPGTWHRVKVTHVAHFDRFYVHFINDNKAAERPPSFGVVSPPMSLEHLVRDMNCPATRMAHKPVRTVPAPGELVAALYLDGMWYRARVVSSTRADQNVEVLYIDYGNVVWVKEDSIRELSPRYWSLEAQACRCSLAGVASTSTNSRHWASARDALTRIINEQTLQAHIVAREYEEVTVELFDDNECSIAEQLAVCPYVTLEKYNTVPDTGVRKKLVVP